MGFRYTFGRAGAVCAVAAAVGLGLGGWARASIPIQFTLGPMSGVGFQTFRVQADTAGTLVGDWDPETNPSGTRTKPGVFGSFGATENVPVPSEVDVIVAGSPSVPVFGGLDMDLTPATGLAEVAGLTATAVGTPGGIASLPLSARIVFDPFRTRNPTSTFPGGVPVTIPIGNGVLESLTLTQLLPAFGSVSELGGMRYAVTVPVLVGVSGEVSALGSAFPFGPLPVPVVLAGEVQLDDMGGASLTGSAPLSLEQTLPLEVELPPLPLELPTVLPPGSVANVIFSLTLQQLSVNLSGTVTVDAQGVVVPEPAAAGAWGALAVGLVVRRPRRF